MYLHLVNSATVSIVAINCVTSWVPCLIFK